MGIGLCLDGNGRNYDRVVTKFDSPLPNECRDWCSSLPGIYFNVGFGVSTSECNCYYENDIIDSAPLGSSFYPDIGTGGIDRTSLDLGDLCYKLVSLYAWCYIFESFALCF